MVDFALSDEETQVRDTVRDFVRREVMPLEPEVLAGERAGHRPGLGALTSCASCSSRHAGPASGAWPPPRSTAA